MKPLRYLSLFSGIGGFEVGIQKVFPHAECVGYSEINNKSMEVYKKHFPSHKYLGPVEQVRGKYKVDLVVGGSPCQDLSISNVKERNGLKGVKSNLFYEFVRVVKENSPCYFILENVASMKNVDKDKITSILKVKPILINSLHFAPQNRKRLFWTNIPVDLRHLETIKTKKLKSILIPTYQAKTYKVNPNESRTYEAYLRKKEKYGSVLDMSVINNDDDYTPALLGGRAMWINDKRIKHHRKLSPVEAERLQTFPDHWTDGLAYTNRLKVLGNAVTCDVIAFIVLQLKNKRI